MNRQERSFTVLGVVTRGGKKSKSNEGGRFVSRTPSGAAMKAFTQTCRQSKIHGVCSLYITMKETTAGSEKKSYRYKFNRVKLNKPVKVGRKSNQRTYKYRVVARKA